MSSMPAMASPLDPLSHLDPTIVVFTADEASEILKCDPVTVRRMCRAGTLYAVKLKREWRIPRWVIVRYLTGQDASTPDPGVDVLPFRRIESRHG